MTEETKGMDAAPESAAGGAKEPVGFGPVNSKIFLVAALLLLVWFGARTCRQTHPLEGKAAPVFTAAMLDGGAFALADYLGKQPIVLDFWAVWCPPCRQALPKVAAAAAAHADSVTIVAVNLGEEAETVRNFLQGRGLSLPVVLDADDSIAKAYQVSGIPMLVFIDRQGVIARVHVGVMSEDSLNDAIEEIL